MGKPLLGCKSDCGLGVRLAERDLPAVVMHLGGEREGVRLAEGMPKLLRQVQGFPDPQQGLLSVPYEPERPSSVRIAGHPQIRSIQCSLRTMGGCGL